MWPPVRNALPAIAAICTAAGLLVAAASFAQDKPSAGVSAKLFQQMASVFTSPRCLNCHPSGSFPTQGDDRHPHSMNVMRGPNDHGAAGLHCSTCHQRTNQVASGVPGAPDWHLAPLRMGWQGLSASAICRAIFDPAHGGMKPAQLVAHFNTGLVRWAWSPGGDAHGRPRTPPPIDYDAFVKLTAEWVAAGAACPQD